MFGGIFNLKFTSFTIQQLHQSMLDPEPTTDDRPFIGASESHNGVTSFHRLTGAVTLKSHFPKEAASSIRLEASERTTFIRDSLGTMTCYIKS